MNKIFDDISMFLWIAIVAIVGGTMGHLARKDTSKMTKKQKLQALIAGIVTSMFVAYITYEISLYIFDRERLSIALAGLGAYMGTNALIAFENAFIEYIKNKVSK